MAKPLKFSEMKHIVKFVSENGIKILNLCHIPEDGRLKTLSFSVTHAGRTREILELGERVDGSSLFSFIDPAKSDIYIQPTLKAFMNPFASTPTLNILCDYLDRNGHPLDVSPKSTLARAEDKLRSSNNITLKALAELEFYAIIKPEARTPFSGGSDKNYHESAPFAHFENARNEILTTLAAMGIATKYSHSEVGHMSANDGALFEQHEIELAAQNLTSMAETIAIAKWVTRNVSVRHGVAATFIPKIDLEHTGSGLHIHFSALRNGHNIIADPDGALSSEAKMMMGGMLKLAPSLSAFTNPTPVSYLRLVARRESPFHICWSASNRLALIRIPLWWDFKSGSYKTTDGRATFEYRAPDAFANPFLLFAAMAVAVNYGLTNPRETLKAAENLRVEAGEERRRLKTLPRSCSEAAGNLERDRHFYEANGVFTPAVIDKVVERLESYADRDLWERVVRDPAKVDNLVKSYLHYG